jgi:hypothetical protein
MVSAMEIDAVIEIFDINPSKLKDFRFPTDSGKEFVQIY